MTEPIRMKLPNSEPIRLCTECRHCYQEDEWGLFCSIAINTVKGEEACCSDVRSDPALCGLSGTRWEPK